MLERHVLERETTEMYVYHYILCMRKYVSFFRTTYEGNPPLIGGAIKSSASAASTHVRDRIKHFLPVINICNTSLECKIENASINTYASPQVFNKYRVG